MSTDSVNIGAVIVKNEPKDINSMFFDENNRSEVTTDKIKITSEIIVIDDHDDIEPMEVESHVRVVAQEITKQDSTTIQTVIVDNNSTSMFFKEESKVIKEESPLKTEQPSTPDKRGRKNNKNNKDSPQPRSSTRLKEKERINYNVLDDDEYFEMGIGISTRDTESMKEEAAAISADLSPYELTPLEIKELPLFANYPGAYLQIRNHLLRLWNEDLLNYVTIERAVEDIQEKYRCFVPPIFQFLRRFGFINTGVITGVNPFKAELKKTVIVVGAGFSGLAAARQLKSLGYNVIVLEGRDRVGGRVNSDTSFGGAVDLGASIVTGLEGNPLTVICKQVNSKLHELGYECPIFDIDGKKITNELDQITEKQFNTIMDEAAEKRDNLPPSLGDAISYFMNQYGGTDAEHRMFNWHIANLEYACATELNKVSLHHWDQDDKFEWAGAHCMLRDGYSSLAIHIAKDLDIKFNNTVDTIQYNEKGVKITTTNGNSYDGDVALVTLPLGVLKEGTVKFKPNLPDWKNQSIRKLGFGLLNKCILLFPNVFWDDTIDYFGQTNNTNDTRGEFYLFWNLHRVMGKPVLVALMAGKAAFTAEHDDDNSIAERALKKLRTLYGPDIPSPVKIKITKWGSDKYARGTYSYIGVDATGDDYDSLAKPLENKLFFAGEATTREHPATVSGAYLTGLRTAGSIDKCLGGDIKIDFDVARLTDEWKKEMKLAGKNKGRKKYMSDSHDIDYRYRRGKRGRMAKKSKFSESYSWLFSYHIPKKQKTSPEKKKEYSPKSLPVTPNSITGSATTNISPMKNNSSNVGGRPLAVTPSLSDLIPKNRKMEMEFKKYAALHSQSLSTLPSPSFVNLQSTPTPVTPPTKQTSFYDESSSNNNNDSNNNRNSYSSVARTNSSPSLHSNHGNYNNNNNNNNNNNGKQLQFTTSPNFNRTQSSESINRNYTNYSTSNNNNNNNYNTNTNNNKFNNVQYKTQQPQLNYSSSNKINNTTSPISNNNINGNNNGNNSNNSTPTTPSSTSNGTTNSGYITAITHIKLTAKENKEKVRDSVLKYLDKYMKDGVISNKDDFKILARKLTHLCPYIIDFANETTSNKVIKERLSDNIVKTLNKYTKDKIQSKEDFKHFARKLTHIILLKESAST